MEYLAIFKKNKAKLCDLYRNILHYNMWKNVKKQCLYKNAIMTASGRGEFR